jgi:hypothetical protein
MERCATHFCDRGAGPADIEAKPPGNCCSATHRTGHRATLTAGAIPLAHFPSYV